MLSMAPSCCWLTLCVLLTLCYTSQCDHIRDIVTVVSPSCPDYSTTGRSYSMFEFSGSAQGSASGGGGGGGGGCVQLTEALVEMASHTTLELRPGIHWLEETPKQRPIGDLDDITIRGTAGGGEGVYIMCDGNTGLGFVNITGLSISNVTMIKCGVSGEVLSIALQSLGLTSLSPSPGFSPSPTSSYLVPADAKIALLFGACRDVHIHTVTVTNTTGLGILALNVRGNSSFKHLIITHNMRANCSSEMAEIGGGVWFVYQDSSVPDSTATALYDSTSLEDMVTVSDTLFSRNAACKSGAKTDGRFERLFQKSISSSGGSGGGGMTVILRQHTFRVKVTVERSTFQYNNAWEGGGAYVRITSGITGSSVSFIACAFNSNGQGNADTGLRNSCFNGAGLAVKTDIARYRTQDEPRVYDPQLATIVRISATNFTNNAALNHGGGILAESAHGILELGTTHHKTEWILEDCRFVRNKASHGSAGHFSQDYLHLQDGMMALNLTNIDVTASKLQTSASNLTIPFSSSALDIEKTNTTVHGRLTCMDNAVTALYLRSSELKIADNTRVLFSRNSGYKGGAVHLRGARPLIRLQRNSSVIFDNNSATIMGGGVYVSTPYTHEEQIYAGSKFSRCFVYPPTIGNSTHLFNLSGELSEIRFTNNIAPVGGDIYGSTLASCPWVSSLEAQHNVNVYQALFNESGFIKFDRYPDSMKTISTLAVRMSVYHISTSDGVNEGVITAYPGQTIRVRIKIYDDLEQVIASVVQSTTFNNPLATAMLGRTGIQLVDKFSEYNHLKLTGRENYTFDVTFIEILSAVSVNLTATFLPCALGYEYNKTTQSCECSIMLVKQGVECNTTNMEELVIPPDTWVGMLDHHTNESYKENYGSKDIVVSKCQLRYCNNIDTITALPNSDKICAEGSMKTGVLCGACRPNHSAVLGRYNKCSRCDNKWLALISAFAISGVLLFAAIAFFQLTVDKGWMYVIIFYCNIVTLYAYLLPVSSPLHIVLIPAHLVSLQIGYEVCFYDGMTTLAHVGIQLAFPAYLYTLMAVFVLLSRRSSWLTQHFSPTQTLLTLIVMSYTSILEICVSSLYGITLNTLGWDTSTLRWQADANVEYFSDWHAALVVVSTILILFYIAPLPLLMLFPMLIYKHTKRFKPFFDAMWAPFKTKLRLWLGMRFLVLVCLYLIAYIDRANRYGTLAFVTMLLIFNQVQTSIQPFKNKWINRTDGFLTMTVILLIALTYESSAPGESEKQRKTFNVIQQVLMYTCFGLAYLTLLTVLLYSLTARFCKMEHMRGNCLARLRTCCSRARLSLRTRQHSIGQLEMTSFPHHPTMNSFRLQFSRRGKQASSFSHLRETLLDTDID